MHVFFNPSIFETVDIYVSSAQVRIFPYLIGRESAFADNLKWMACANKGLGLFDKHFPRHLRIRVLNGPDVVFLCSIMRSRGCVGSTVVWLRYVCLCVHAYVCVQARILSAKR